MGSTAILIPSLGRSQHVLRTIGNIDANTPEPHDQWWCVYGDEYIEKLNAAIHQRIGFHGRDSHIYYVVDDDTDDHRYVTRMNRLVRHILDHAVTGPYDYMFFGSDDVVHHPGWLTKAIEIMEGAEGAQVVVVNDLRNPNGTQALVRTSYLPLAVFDDPMSAFHPGYQHNFADTEMFLTAQKRGVIYRAMDSHVEHLHPLHGGANQRAWDKTYADAQSHWDEDAERFHKRMTAMTEALDEQDRLPDM